MAFSLRGSFRRANVAVCALYAGLTVAFTWSLVGGISKMLPDSDDAYFSTWRLAWFARAAFTNPQDWLNANVFFPEKRTLLLSDAMPALGMMGIPMGLSGLQPVTVHNTLLLLSFLSASLAAHWAAYRATGQRLPALVAGTVFGFAPYRFAHFGHLELLWTCWIATAFVAFHAITEGDRRQRWPVVLAGSVWLQLHTSVYYGVYLGIILFVAVVCAPFCWRPDARPLVRRLVTPIAMAGVLAAPYLLLYDSQRKAAGPRTESEISRYSAVPTDYLAAPPESVLHSSRTAPPGVRDERTLYPGVVTVALALIGLFAAKRAPEARLHIVLAAIAFDLSLGVNGVGHRVLVFAVPGITSLRSPARFAALGLFSLALLSAYGTTAVLAAVKQSRTKLVATFMIIAGIALDYSTAPALRVANVPTASVVRWLRSTPVDSVILCWPAPRPDALWGFETTYQFQSIWHFRRMVNGYSGFAPRTYLELMERLHDFPSQESLRSVVDAGVTHVVVHEEFFRSADEFARTVQSLSALLEERPIEIGRTPSGHVLMYALKGRKASDPN